MTWCCVRLTNRRVKMKVSRHTMKLRGSRSGKNSRNLHATCTASATRNWPQHHRLLRQELYCAQEGPPRMVADVAAQGWRLCLYSRRGRRERGSAERLLCSRAGGARPVGDRAVVELQIQRWR